MRASEFNKILSSRLEKTRATLGTKAREYAMDDRLHNFRIAALVNGTTAPHALWGMATKHLVSIMDIIEGRKPNIKVLVEEKIGDLVNYLILLEAILQEDREGKEGKEGEDRNG